MKIFASDRLFDSTEALYVKLLQSVTKFVATVHDYTDLKLSQLTLPSQCCFNASF